MGVVLKSFQILKMKLMIQEIFFRFKENFYKFQKRGKKIYLNKESYKDLRKYSTEISQGLPCKQL